MSNLHKLIRPHQIRSCGNSLLLGFVATGMLAHANTDGYTLMAQHMGLAFNAALYEKASFDTARDVLPVAYLGATE